VSRASYDKSGWTPWVLFASAIMFLVGALDVIQGLSALLKSDVYSVRETGLLAVTDFTPWGITLVAWGVVLLVSAASLLKGEAWGRWFAIVVLLLNGIIQLAWFPAYPLWSLLSLGLMVAVLYALTAAWKDVGADLRR